MHLLVVNFLGLFIFIFFHVYDLVTDILLKDTYSTGLIYSRESRDSVVRELATGGFELPTYEIWILYIFEVIRSI